MAFTYKDYMLNVIHNPEMAKKIHNLGFHSTSTDLVRNWSQFTPENINDAIERVSKVFLSKPSLYELSHWGARITTKSGSKQAMPSTKKNNQWYDESRSYLNANPILNSLDEHSHYIYSPEEMSKEYDLQINEGADSYHNKMKNFVFNHADFTSNKTVETLHDFLNVGFNVADEKKFVPYSSMSGDVKTHNDNLQKLYKEHSIFPYSKMLELYSTDNSGNRLLISKSAHSNKFSVTKFFLQGDMKPHLVISSDLDPTTPLKDINESLHLNLKNMRYGTTYNIKEPKEMLE